MLRYHSFCAAHRRGAYRHLMNDHDEVMFAWVRKFNPYDLYSKGLERPDARPAPFLSGPCVGVFPRSDGLEIGKTVTQRWQRGKRDFLYQRRPTRGHRATTWPSPLMPTPVSRAHLATNPGLF